MRKLKNSNKEEWFIGKLIKNEIKWFRSGNNIMIPCPFHGEENPSLGVNLEKNVFNCMACGEKGNTEYLMAFLFSEKYKELKEEKESEEFSLNSLEEKLNNLILNEDKLKIKILVNFDLESFKFPEGEYLRYLEQRNIKRFINKIDLWKEFDIRGGFWKGKKRIIIPQKDEFGRIISIYGRAINTDERRLKVRKSKESDSSKILFGLYFLLKNSFFNFNKTIILVEGEFDCLRLVSSGIPAVSLGTKNISDIQLYKISKYFETVYLVLDGEVSSIEKNKVAKRIREWVNKVIIIDLPTDKDPNKLSDYEVEYYIKNKIKRIKRGGV